MYLEVKVLVKDTALFYFSFLSLMDNLAFGNLVC